MATRPVPVPVPTPTPPKQQSVTPRITTDSGKPSAAKTSAIPTSTPSIPSNPVSSGSGYAQGGWYPVGAGGKAMQFWNGSFYDSPQQGNNSSSSDSGYQAPSIDFDSLYAPQFAALDAATNTANANFDLASQDIARSKTSQLSDVQSEQDKAQQYFDDASQRASKNKDSAYSDAIRYFNALQQRAKAQFGRGNSAGPAVGEIANSEFVRNQGNIEQSYADIQKELEGKWQDAVKTYSSTRLKIDDWAATQISSLRQNLNTQLVQIQMSRAQTESDKTAKRLEVLDRARQELNAINLQKQQQSQALETWKEQQQFLIQNKLVPIYSQTLNTSGYTPTTSTLSAPTSTQGSSLISTLRWNPNAKRFEDDNGQALGGLSYVG